MVDLFSIVSADEEVRFSEFISLPSISRLGVIPEAPQVMKGIGKKSWSFVKTRPIRQHGSCEGSRAPGCTGHGVAVVSQKGR